MDVLEYLEKYQFYHTEYLTLLESESTIIDKGLYGGLYNYFFNVRGESYHVLTQNLNMTVMMKPELYILINNSGLNNKVAYCDIKYKIRLNCNTLTIFLVIYDNPKNPLEVPFIYSLDDPGTSFELSKLLEEETIDVFFIEAIKDKLYQRNFRRIDFDKETKDQVRNLIQEYLDAQYLDDEEEEDFFNFVDMLNSSNVDYLNLAIAREDIENNNIGKYLEMLDPLYPNIPLANKFCEKVSLFIEGYDYDHRELWEIPEVRRFIKSLNAKFHYWFYFLDKNTSSLMWITLALFGTGKGQKDGYEIDNKAFNDFLHEQMVYLNEVCLCSNGTKDKVEKLRDNVYKYYGMI